MACSTHLSRPGRPALSVLFTQMSTNSYSKGNKAITWCQICDQTFSSRECCHGHWHGNKRRCVTCRHWVTEQTHSWQWQASEMQPPDGASPHTHAQRKTALFFLCDSLMSQEDVNTVRKQTNKKSDVILFCLKLTHTCRQDGEIGCIYSDEHERT